MQIQPTVSMMLEIKFFFFNSNYKNVKNINQKKKVQFLKNKRLHKTYLILCTLNIHMPNCYHTNSTTMYTQETNCKMYTKNLFNIKKTQILYSIAHVNTKCSYLENIVREKIIPVLSIQIVQHTEVFGSVLR